MHCETIDQITTSNDRDQNENMHEGLINDLKKTNRLLEITVYSHEPEEVNYLCGGQIGISKPPSTRSGKDYV